MPQDKKPWEKYGAPRGPIFPDPTQPYKGPTAAADLAAKRQEAELRQLAIDKARKEAAVPPDADVSPDVLASITAGKPVRLEDLPAGARGIVSGLLQGNLPAGQRSIASKSMLPYIKMAMSVDPSFNANVFAARGALLKDYVDGETSKNITALRTAIGHAGHLRDQIDGTFSGPAVPLNAIGNAIDKNLLGDSGPGLYEQTRGHLAEEATKVFRPQGGSVSDVQRNLNDLSPSASRKQKLDSITNLMQLFQSRLAALDTKFKQGMGAGANGFQIIDPGTQQIIDRIAGVAPGSAGGGGTNGPGGGPVPTIRPPGGGGGGPSPYAGPGPVSDLSASGSAGQNVVGTGYNAVPNPAGQALYKDYLGLWAAKASDDTIRKWSQKVYAQNPAAMQDVEAALQARSQGKKIAFHAADGLLTTNVPSTDGLVGKIADTSASPLGTFAANAGNQVAAGLPQYLASNVQGGNRDLTDLRFDTMNAQNPNAATFGQLSGGAAGAMLGEGAVGRGLTALPSVYRGLQGADRAAAIAPWAARGGDTLYGGVSGATGNPDNPLLGGAEGGLAGLGGGMLGRRVVRGAGATLRGVTNPAVQYLDRSYIPLTLGQAVAHSGIVGKTVKGVEDAMTSLPVIGDVLNYTRNRGIKKFNNAAFREALAPVAHDIPPSIGEQGVEMGLGKVGDAFNNALGGQSVTIPLNRSHPFMQAVTAGASSKTGGDQFIDVLDRNIAPIANKGTITGHEFQQLDRSIDGYARKFDTLANGTPVIPAQPGYEPVAGAFRDMSGALTDAVRSSNPTLLPQYDAAKTAYRNTMVLKDAVNRARNGTRSGEAGVFMPSQLSDAAAANSRIFGGTQGTTDQPFFQLTRAGQDVLPSKLADSGTAKRLAINAPFLAAGGGAYAYGNDDAQGALGDTAGTMATLAAVMSPAGQRALRAMVLKRPEFLRRLGTTTMNNAAPYAGMFGAPIALQQLQGN